MKALSRHNSNKKRRFKIVIFSVIFIGLGLLAPKFISVVSTSIMYPVHVANNWLENSSSLVPSFIRDRKSLQSEIDELENQLAVSTSVNLTLQRLVDENNRLRKLLGAEGNSRVAAAVVARPNELPYDFLQIDRGSEHGIEIGAPVFAGKDVVIGLVVHTAPKYSFVELITTPGFEATAFISGPNVVATLEGYGGGVARVRVPQGIPITIGNLVYLPSVETGVFGRISFIENELTQPEQYGYISMDVAISGLHQVAVGKQSQITRSVTEIDERIIERMRTELLVEELVTGSVGTTSTTSEEFTESSEESS